MALECVDRILRRVPAEKKLPSEHDGRRDRGTLGDSRRPSVCSSARIGHAFGDCLAHYLDTSVVSKSAVELRLAIASRTS